MKNTILYIWFQLSVGICNRLTRDILHRFESITEVYNCDDFSFLGEKREKYIKRLENKDTADAFEIMKRCESKGIKVTGYYDELYPASLRDIDAPPAVLYSIGNFRDLNSNPCIAVVGTRKMSDYGKEIAERFAYTFAKSGAFVISGLAKGIDVSAHRGAVMADGYTVGVLGNPIDEIYPKENERAFKTLYERGLVLSELYPNAPRTRADFPNRNRIISAISDALVVAEAGEGSGALITAKHAISQGKPVYAVPGAIGAENAGTNHLIKTGVPVATEAGDVLMPLSLEYPEKIHVYEPSVTAKLRSYGNVSGKKPVRIPKKFVEPPKPEKTSKSESFEPLQEVLSGSASDKISKVLSANGGMCADEICVRTGLTISQVMIELTLMEIDGIVAASAGGRYSVLKKQHN